MVRFDMRTLYLRNYVGFSFDGPCGQDDAVLRALMKSLNHHRQTECDILPFDENIGNSEVLSVVRADVEAHENADV